MNSITKHLSLLTAFLLCFLSIHAQDQPDLRDRAERYFKEYQYAKAAAIYLQLTDVRKPYLHDLENLAACYAKMNCYEDAEIWYARVVQHPKSNLENLISYGRILKANAHYVKAKELFQKYAGKSGKPDRVAVDMAGCDSAEIWMAHPLSYRLRNENGINSERAEFSILPVSDSLIYFTAEPPVVNGFRKYGWTGSAYLRIFKAVRSKDNVLGSPILADLDLNREVYHVGPIASNRSGDVYFVTRTYPGKNGRKSTVDGRTYRTNNMELYILAKVYGKWKNPEPFAYNNVKKYSVGHAALSLDGKILYFVSDMPGGFGGTDIWYCELQKDGSWGKCKNAGKGINTTGNELFPSIAPDGTLYFSSDGMPGMGGLDIFRTGGERNQWAKPVNMRYPFNSPGDDFASFVDNNLASGYLSSNRENGKGNDDIYSFVFQKSKALLVLAGTAYDKQSKKVLPGASVTLFDDNNNIVARQQQTQPDGRFAFDLDKAIQYHLQGTKFSYYPDTATIGVQGGLGKDTIRLALNLDPLFEKGKIFRLKNILYDFDKDNIRHDAALILDELVRIMHENPTLKIELGSHTDSRGTAEYNQDLSQRRAQSSVNYLVTRGIARSRMVAKGYGESRLLNRCADGVDCTEAEHQLNRRTEFMVLEY
jgi:Outer membrane protein and related peptidoglycan-associated (lipo)proteins